MEPSQYQDHLLAIVPGTVTTVKALNVQLTAFAADIEGVAVDYTIALSSDLSLQAICEAVYPTIRVQAW